jgi:hypothetical protein
MITYTCKGQTYALINFDWSAIADAVWEGLS